MIMDHRTLCNYFYKTNLRNMLRLLVSYDARLRNISECWPIIISTEFDPITISKDLSIIYVRKQFYEKHMANYMSQ